MSYTHDMSKEREQKELLEKGWREFSIISCIEKTSKNGNLMFEIDLKDKETEQVETVYAVATPGKRWFLKSVLTAVGVEAGKDGIYTWDIPDVLNKAILGFVEHIPEEFIDRSGTTRNVIKGKITKIKPVNGAEIPF